MVDKGGVLDITTTFDPFSEAEDNTDPLFEVEKETVKALPLVNEYVHLRLQQRNGRKTLTTIQGLSKKFSNEKILKNLKKEFCCNGTVVRDKELGEVIQLQGDQRKKVQSFLVDANIVQKELIKIHGF